MTETSDRRQLRKTKIVATVGPACDDVDTLTRMIEAGMNVARFNFSHEDHERHARRLEREVPMKRFADPGEAEFAIDDFFLVCGAGDNAVFKAFEEAMSVLDGAFEGDDEEPDGDDPYGEGGEPDVSVDSVMVEALDG